MSRRENKENKKEHGEELSRVGKRGDDLGGKKRGLEGYNSLTYNYMQMNEHTHAANGREDDQSHAEVHPQAPPHAKQQPAAKLPVKTQV